MRLSCATRWLEILFQQLFGGVAVAFAPENHYTGSWQPAYRGQVTTTSLDGTAYRTDRDCDTIQQFYLASCFHSPIRSFSVFFSRLFPPSIRAGRDRFVSPFISRA
ncbi:hypothetical protein V8F06_003560 [Rhypophila decipiens]